MKAAIHQPMIITNPIRSMTIRSLFIIFTTGILLSCNEPHPAEQDLRDAQAAWDEGHYPQAFALLEMVVLEYGDHRVADKALKLRENFMQAYRQIFNPYGREQIYLNGCGIAASVYSDLIEEHAKKKEYPKNLQNLYTYKKLPDIVSNCLYEKGLFNAGFRLDCQRANHKAKLYGVQKDWLQTINSLMVFDAFLNINPYCNDDLMAIDKNTGKPVLDYAMNIAVSWQDFPLASDTIFDALPISSTLPDNGFSAVFYDQRHPRTSVTQEIVQHIGIGVAENQAFKNIAAQHLAAGWRGTLHIPASDDYRFVYPRKAQSFRVILNDHVILDAKHRPESLFLPQGEYTLEVEYANTEGKNALFFLDIAPVRQKPTLATLLAPWQNTAEIYYSATTYKPDPYLRHTIRLHREDATKPAVLIIHNAPFTHWHVEGENIALIAHSSSEGANTIMYDGSAQIVAYANDLGDPEQYFYLCPCWNQVFYCEDTGAKAKFYEYFWQRTGLALTGASYSEAGQHDIRVPEVIFGEDPAFPENLEHFRHQRIACESPKAKDSALPSQPAILTRQPAILQMDKPN